MGVSKKKNRKSENLSALLITIKIKYYVYIPINVDDN